VSYSPAGLALGKHIQGVCCKHGKDATGASLAGITPCSLRTAGSCWLNVNAMHTCCAQRNARRPCSGRRVHMCLAQRTRQRRVSPGASYFGGASTGCVFPFACIVKYTLTALPGVCRSLRTHTASAMSAAAVLATEASLVLTSAPETRSVRRCCQQAKLPAHGCCSSSSLPVQLILKSLETDLRKVMQPNTATNLRVRASSYVRARAGPGPLRSSCLAVSQLLHVAKSAL